jgi:hypothetical protein
MLSDYAPSEVMVVLDWDWTVTSPLHPMTHDMVLRLECLGPEFVKAYSHLYESSRTWDSPCGWWDEAHSIMVQYGFRRGHVPLLCTPLRSGFKEFMDFITVRSYRSTVISAGLADVIEYTLSDLGVSLTHGVVSNKMSFTHDGKLLGFGPVVSSSNKRMPQDLWDSSGCRAALVVGDTASDTLVMQGVSGVEQQLSVGFVRRLQDYEVSAGVARAEDVFDVSLPGEAGFEEVVEIFRKYGHKLT